MKPVRAIAILAAALGLAAPALAAPPDEPPAHAHAQARVQRVDDPHGKPHAGHVRGSRARAVTLAPPAPGEVEGLLGAPQAGIPLKVGFARDIPGLDTAPATAGALDWQRLGDGSLVADLRITSEGAKAVRGVLRVDSLPPQAVLRFQAPNDDQVFEVTGQEVADALARNADAGAPPRLANLYWSPVTEGPTVVVEIELPPGVDPIDVRLSVPKVSHLARSPVKDTFTTQSSATCERDAMCSAAQWGSQMNAVARMIFSDGTYSYACTGTLLADSDPSGDIPYFLTANHCINTQTEASSLNTYWFYRSTACNSGVPGPYRQLAGGATLLYNTTATDTSFLRLDATPPAGAVYAGWTVGATPAVGAPATGLHHPMADLLKISSGNVGGYLNCTPPTNGQFSCSGASAGSSTFYEIDWTNGITESGSSGSGVFDANGNLIGQLYGGSSSCGAPGADAYGRFDVAYANGLKRWLAAPDAALTVAKAGSGSGTVTSTPAGIACGSTCSASFPAGTVVSLAAAAGAGSRFTGWGGACSGTGACSVTLDAARDVTANFAASSGTVSVIKSGGGTVTSAPAGIACGSTCSASFAAGSALTLTETPATGYAFSGWSGFCSGSAVTCSLSVNGSVSVGATFVASAPPSSGGGTGGATGDVAAASAGAVASASSTLGSRYPVSALIDGDRTGAGFGAGGIWEDANAYTFPDWVQVQFAAPQAIDRVVVYSMQDAYSRPVEPTDTMTFHSYGVTDFSVEAWNGSAWTTLATVAGNNLVKRTVTFAPVTTDRIRVVIANALNGYSRLAEIEAWSAGSTGTAAPGSAAIGLTSSANPSTAGQAVTFTASLTGGSGTPTGSVAFLDGGTAIAGCSAVPLASGVASCSSAALLAGNHSITASYAGDASYAAAISTPLTQAVQATAVSGGSGTEIDVAAASAGASAIASSTLGTRYPVTALIDGDRTGAGFGNGGVWEDANAFVFPDWVEIDFAGVKTIDRVVVYSMQDAYTHPVIPDDALTFHSYGVTAFTVQVWDGAEWAAVGRVTGNNLVKRTVTFPAVATDRVRIVIDDALNGYSRLAEVEAWGG